MDAQYEAAFAYIKSQAHAGWTLIRSRYDDGGYSGGSTDRPDLQRLLDDIRSRKIDVIVVYKVDRLTRSLVDFAKLVELFDAHGVSFVSVTQQFNWRRRFNSRSFFFGGRSRKQRACRSGALGQFELGLSRKAIIRVPRRLVVFQNMETQSIAIILE